jgi:hypothetical protein
MQLSSRGQSLVRVELHARDASLQPSEGRRAVLALLVERLDEYRDVRTPIVPASGERAS